MFNEKSIISKWIADIYDQKVLETHDVDFILSIIGNKPKKILEISCGSGRILIPLAKAGHNVYGLDFDKYMLAKIETKAKDFNNIQWKASDVVYDDWGIGFDVVILAGNILYNIISDMEYSKTQELLIKKAASALIPGGCVLIEYQPGNHRITRSTPSYSNESRYVVWDGTDEDGNHGRMTLIGDNYDADTRMSSFTRRFELTLKNGEVITQDIPCQKHFAPLDLLHEWLHNAGFNIEQEYNDYNKNPVNSKSNRVIIYARKR